MHDPNATTGGSSKELPYFNLPNYNPDAALSASMEAILHTKDEEMDEHPLGFTQVSASGKSGVKPGKTIPKSRPRKPVAADAAKKDVPAIPQACE